MGVKVVEEGNWRARITQRREVFKVADLHAGVGEEHAGMPAELVLFLEEENFARYRFLHVMLA